MKFHSFKRSFLLCLATILIIGLFPVSEVTAANNEKEVVLYEAKPITDLNLLLERAKSGITDKEVKTPSPNSEFTLDSKSNTDSNSNSIDTKYYSTTQKIKSVQKGNQIVDSYITTSFAVSGDSKSQSKPDSSGGVIAHSSFSYDTQYKNNLSYYKLTSVSGGWTVQDRQILLSDRTVIYGASGNSLEGGFGITQTSGKINLASNSFSYTPPSNWYYVTNDAYSIIGVTTTINLKRGSTTWQLTFPLKL